MGEIVLKDNFKEFLKTAKSENPVMVDLVVLSIYCEKEIDQLIRENCKRPSEPLDWFYDKKRKFLFSLGIIDVDLNHNLRTLSQARNEYVHEANTDLLAMTKLTLRYKENGKAKLLYLSELKNIEEALNLLFKYTLLHFQLPFKLVGESPTFTVSTSNEG